MVEPVFDYQFRLILIGDSTVGKSALLRYFCNGKYEECEPTVGVDFYCRLISVRKGVRVKLQLWDTAGQERFRSITKSYYRNSVGGLLVFDITNRESFNSVAEWLAEALSHTYPRQTVFIIVGHKSDLESEREVLYTEGQNFAKRHGIAYFETSAMTGENIEIVFDSVAKTVFDKMCRGDLVMEEGWEGIKDGMVRQNDDLLLEAVPERIHCC